MTEDGSVVSPPQSQGVANTSAFRGVISRHATLSLFPRNVKLKVTVRRSEPTPIRQHAGNLPEAFGKMSYWKRHGAVDSILALSIFIWLFVLGPAAMLYLAMSGIDPEENMHIIIPLLILYASVLGLMAMLYIIWKARYVLKTGGRMYFAVWVLWVIAPTICAILFRTLDK